MNSELNQTELGVPIPKPIPVAVQELDALDWITFFGNTNPVEVEIGCGKAGFLLRRAMANPQRNFLGIEWANEFYKFAVDRMQRRGMLNVRVVRTDAAHFIRTKCPQGSISVLHIYHPDPWPKKRHHKRRLFQPAFVEAAVRCLAQSGRLAVQTDHEAYFEIIRGLLRAHPGLEQVEFADAEFDSGDARVHTNFEIKYLQEGRAIYQIAMRKRPLD